MFVSNLRGNLQMSYLQFLVLPASKDIFTAEESIIFLFCKANLCNHLSPKADIGYVTYANLLCVTSYLRIWVLL